MAIPDLQRLVEASARQDFDPADLAAMIAKFCGDRRAVAVDALVSRMTDHPQERAAIRLNLAFKTIEIAGNDATPIEVLLAERIAYDRLECSHADRLAIIANNHPDFPASIASQYDKYRTRCQKRMLNGVKTLAVVRRLAVPGKA